MKPTAGTQVLVHGLGRFGGGREAVRYLLRCGCNVRVVDRSNSSDLESVRHSLGDCGIDWQLGREDVAMLDGIDLLVANPAIPDDHPLLAAAVARGIAITQELNLLLAAYPGKVVGITGTNGKSTTATLLHRALLRGGIPSLLGGNIGHSLLADEAGWATNQIAVVEMSSFQLQRLDPALRVAGAVFTRVTQDHLDRHGTLIAYHQAKGRLALAADDFTVYCAEDDVAAGYPTSAATRWRYALTEPAPNSAGVRDGFLSVRTASADPEPIVHRSALRLIGDFQVENVMAAIAAARHLGAQAGDIGIAMATAPPLPFRLQLVATIAKVRIYDNAVSSEAESTAAAIRAIAASGRVHWVGGGKSKDGDYARAARTIAPHVASAHLFGQAAGPLAKHWAKDSTTTTHEHLQDALAAAQRAAQPGDALLFSPAFASFDQYPNFRARALAFHEWLVSRRAEAAVSG